MTLSHEIRQTFLQFFAKSGHCVVPTAPLVPQNDPSLLFVNAGMVPFKDIFTQDQTSTFSRAASAQKCLRVGGKHNDLENVGYTARHHTFFEMLGNFSFGDYFKEEAIAFAWDLLTKEFSLPKSRLWVSVYAEDDEAVALWQKVTGIPIERIGRIAGSDNFWSMGDTGPCGPCSEIFYDHGEAFAGNPPGHGDEGERFVEIWNLVFMQYQQDAQGKRHSLPKPSIDTGMGLERLAAVLQGKHDNYATDTFHHLIQTSAELTKTAWDGPFATSHRVIADHVRAGAFLIADGVLPGPEGRSYVLRRILRRALRHVHKLGYKEALLPQLLPALQEKMGQAYPELLEAEALIASTLQMEEERFRKTLERGLSLLFSHTEKLAPKGQLSGEVAFRLYDTYGFPADLTADILREQGRTLDEAGFGAKMEEQKALARKAWQGSGDQETEKLWFSLSEKIPPSEFLGYGEEKAQGEVLALVCQEEENEAEEVQEAQEVQEVQAGKEFWFICNQTPFYPESGGQVSDRGIGVTKSAKVEVLDVQRKVGGLIVHFGKVISGALGKGESLTLSVDSGYRQALREHHSAAHLMHEALRRLLGKQVAQKGSLVGAKRLRFDVSYPRPIPEETLEEVERMVNTRIRANDVVTTRVMGLEEAKKEGAMALFGEKYAQEVRVVSMGGTGLAERGKYAWSVELCGGLHVQRSGEVGLFRVVSESASSSGVRRLEAVAGEEALVQAQEQTQAFRKASRLLHTSPKEVTERLSELLQTQKQTAEALANLRMQQAIGQAGQRQTGELPTGKEPAGQEGKDEQAGQETTIQGVSFRWLDLPDFDVSRLKSLADAVEKKQGSGILLLLSESEDKTSFVVAVSDDLTGRVGADSLVRLGAEVLGGKGGGRKDMAQGGGPKTGQGAQVIEALSKALQESL